MPTKVFLDSLEFQTLIQDAQDLHNFVDVVLQNDRPWQNDQSDGKNDEIQTVTCLTH